MQMQRLVLDPNSWCTKPISTLDNNRKSELGVESVDDSLAVLASNDYTDS